MFGTASKIVSSETEKEGRRFVDTVAALAFHLDVTI